jgi:cellulose synthase/poly-beta-1,6-N-acetylglucosamine synthase-like glycosyltransferase
MIIHTISFILIVANIIVAIPVATVLFEIAAAVTLPERAIGTLREREQRDRVGVLVPAHNEEEMLSNTIINIRNQLRRDDWLLVVADNCSDSTAVVAEHSGADVVVRDDPLRTGKGFALDHGIRHFAENPPRTVIVVDADCQLGDLAVDRLTCVCEATNRPVQALYLMTPDDSAERPRVREFAWRVKNWIRPLGLSSAGLPCQLMGTGMAFPWEVIAKAHLSTGALVEDLKLGLELAADGHPPIFCPAAVVTSEFPMSQEGARSQQLRWEQGHLSLMAVEIPRFLMQAIHQRDLNLLVLTLDAAVPPLSLLWAATVFISLISLGAWLLGLPWMTPFLCLSVFAGFTCALICCWLKNGRDLLSVTSALSLGVKSFTKLPLYYRIIWRKTSAAWVRTDRRRI